MNPGKVYLIPTVLYEASLETIPAYILDAVKECQVFFVENEKTARRFLKKLWKEMVIDQYQWFAIHKAEQEVKQQFLQTLRSGKISALSVRQDAPVLPTLDNCWLKQHNNKTYLSGH